MFPPQSLKSNIKRELVEIDEDVVEILPPRAATKNGGGFSVKIRDTSELTAADIQYLKPFLMLPAVAPSQPAKFTMKELRATRGWEINIEDTSTLTFNHMQCIVGIIASRESELRSPPQNQHVRRQQQHSTVPRGAMQRQLAQCPQPSNGRNAGCRPPVHLAPVALTIGAQQVFRPNAPAKKRGRRPKDPNAPKGPLSAFFLWLKENREHLKERPNMSIGEVSKAAGATWADIPEDEKQRWQERAREEKLRYDRELAEYRQRNLNQD